MGSMELVVDKGYIEGVLGVEISESKADAIAQEILNDDTVMNAIHDVIQQNHP